MNFNNQHNLDTISAELHDLSFTKPTEPVHNSMNYGQPGFLDSIGVQRTKSPFSAQNEGPLLHTPFQKPQLNSIINTWGQAAGYQQPMTPSTSLSSAATPSTANNVQLSNHQFDHTHSVNSSVIHPAAPRTAPAAGISGHYMPPILSQEPQWNYVDQAGQIQGPFSSTLMDSWYSQRFFMQALQIKLSNKKINPFGMDEFTFITLMELILKVSDYVEPFKKFDIICWQFQQQLHEQPSMQSPIASPISLGQLTQLQPQPHVLKTKPIARIESYDYTYDEIMQLKDKDGGHYQQISVAIPVAKTIKRLSDEEFSIEWDAHNLKMTMMKEALEREARVKSSEELANAGDVSTTQGEIEAQAHEQTVVEDTDLQITNSTADTILEVPSATKLARSSINVESVEAGDLPNTKTENNEVDASIKEDTRAPDESGNQKRKVNVPKKEISVKPAPWANKAPSAPEGPSIIEIQKKEEEEKKRREQELVLKSRKQALKMQQDILKQEQPQVSITSVATWASKTKPAETVAKPSTDFEKVYHDRLKEKEFIEEQKRLWDKAQKLYNSNKNASTDNENEWITVTNKHQPKIVPKPIVASVNSVNPDKLRAVSANHNSKLSIRKAGPPNSTVAQKQAPLMYSGNASTSARQEFLRWCRSQMKLLPGVEANSVLEMLLSLPAGPESQEIIADTIYSNSNVMDDRRFAAEFIKRRIECEKKLSDPLTWSQALSLPEGESDDWEFQVVSKKKGRRH